MKNGFALVAAFLAVLMGTPLVALGQSAQIQPASDSALLAKAFEPSTLNSLPEASPAPAAASTSATIALDVVVAGIEGDDFAVALGGIGYSVGCTCVSACNRIDLDILA